MAGRSTTGRPVVVVRRGSSARRLALALRWIRALVPAAVLIVDPGGGAAARDDDEAISVDADEVVSGPLSLAHALLRRAQAAAFEPPPRPGQPPA